MNLPLVLAALAATVLAFVLVLAESAISTTSRVAAEEAEEQGRRGAAPLRLILADSTGYVAGSSVPSRGCSSRSATP